MVVVNYQGPELLRGLVDAMNVPIFHRVRRVEFEYSSFDSIPATNQDLTKLKGLEEVVFSKKSRELTTTDVEAAKQIVSPCRIAGLNQSKSKLAMVLDPASALGCVSSISSLDLPAEVR